MTRLPLSILLLARDEEARLAALLPRLEFARDVVVVVDAASRDDTRAVAERAGARVFERALDGFGPQRRFALEQCREPWVLWIDCDETLDDRAVRAIERAVTSEAVAAYRIARRGWFLGRPIRFCGWRNERVTRLFRRDRARFDDAAVHERVTIDGPIADLRGLIEHDSYATWQECVDKRVRYAAAGAEDMRRRGRRAGPLDLIARPPLRFVRMYVLQLGVLDGARGLLLCLLAGCQVFLKYAGRWSMDRSR
jgi:glycosyltransferase involved in cell wall biosynthesis